MQQEKKKKRTEALKKRACSVIIFLYPTHRKEQEKVYSEIQ